MNILIIGLGSVAKKHISAIRQLQPDAVLYALRSGYDSENHDNIHNIYSLDEIKVTPEFILIANPTALHEGLIVKCLKFGCPLFIEKPVLSTLKNADAIIGLIQRSGINTYVSCNMRFHPAIQFLKSYLELNKLTINEVNIYSGSYLPEWRQSRDFRTIYSAHANMGGGVHLDMIHELDYCVWLFGAPDNVKSEKRSVSSLAIDSIDFAQFTLLYPSFSVNLTLNYYRRDAKREIEVLTSEDTITVDMIGNKISSKVSGICLFQKEFKMIETYKEQMSYFIDCIQSRKQPMNDIEFGIEILKIALYE